MKKPEVSERFFQSFDDPEIFGCGRFNLLKVAQDSLIRRVGKKGFFATYFDKPNWFLKLLFRLKSLRKGKLELAIDKSLQQRPLLVIVPPRFVPDATGQPKLQYFENFGQHLPREKYAVMYLHQPENLHEKPDILLQQMLQQFDSIPPDAEELKFLSDLRNCYHRIQKQGRFSVSDLHHIKTGFDEFWRQFRALKRSFSKFRFKKALLIPGYFTEYLIAALKDNHVEVTEIQHGVITPASHFYIYPPQVKSVAHQALFADKIWLFGDFWKQQLLKGSEYPEEKMMIIGDYFVRQETPPSDLQRFGAFVTQFPRLLLIGTQTKRHPQFIELIRSLSEKYSSENNQCGIIVKPHPAENPELYAEVANLDNVLFTDASLDFLYLRCEAYVSMYSNTLFEATRISGLKRFVLWTEETAALSEAVAASGVAAILKDHDDPMERIPPTENVTPADFYAELNIPLIQSLIY